MKKIVYMLSFLVFIASSDFGQITITLQPGPETGKDATIDSMFPNTNRGNQTDFDAVSWTNSGFLVTFRSLVEFDLSSLPDTTILNATLFLYNDPLSLNNYGQHSSLSGSNIAWLRRITEEWQETSVTWGTQPTVTTLNQVVIPQSQSPHQDYAIDVTALVRDMLSNPESSHGFMLLLQTEEAYRCLVFASSDNIDLAHYPKLSITYPCSAPQAGFFTIQQDQQVSFTDTSRSATSWYWSFGDSTYSMEKNPLHQYQKPGIYEPCLVVSSDCGSDTACYPVTVAPPGNVEEFHLYPNPTDGMVFFTPPFQNDNAFIVEIFNPAGQVIQKYQVTPTADVVLQKIDLSSFNSGVFMIKISQSGFSFLEKVLMVKTP